MTITLHYNESKNVYQATGEDAKKVWDALGIFEIFEPSEDCYNICEIAPAQLQTFTTKMKETYNIEVLTA